MPSISILCGPPLLDRFMIDIDLNLLRSFDILYDASALIFDQNGLRVATVGLDDNVLFKTVTIARDLGRDIELESGISLDDRIVTAPPDGISDGDRVRTVGIDKDRAAAKTSAKVRY
jgi:membrane fusion protein (multidrug efflux system)